MARFLNCIFIYEPIVCSCSHFFWHCVGVLAQKTNKLKHITCVMNLQRARAYVWMEIIYLNYHRTFHIVWWLLGAIHTEHITSLQQDTQQIYTNRQEMQKIVRCTHMHTQKWTIKSNSSSSSSSNKRAACSGFCMLAFPIKLLHFKQRNALLSLMV